ncbi:MAG TPA: hypothetical protein VE732_04650 [Nitrososphaera sp.]|jgi:hypothetical protein|nr:hypothetical protein [Nitrososphaera sp.]
MKDNDYKGKSLLESGVAIAGGVAAYVAGTLIAGPIAGPIAGAAVAAAINDVAKRGLGEFANRLLSSREQARVGAAFAYAVATIQNRIDAGDSPRADNFFQRDETGRSDADEILEGVLLKAKNESEEKKTKYLGNLFANVAFMPGVPATVANFLLRTAEALSYRQFCFLALIEQSGTLEIGMLRLRDHTIADLEVLRREEMYLHKATRYGGCGLIAGNDSQDWLTDLGKTFCDVLDLNDIPEDDLEKLKRLLALAPR